MRTSVDEALEVDCFTKTDIHRARGDPPTNGKDPPVATPEAACETCGGQLTGKQDRFCSRSCGLVGARREQRQRLANPEQIVAGIGPLLAHVIAVAGVAEVEMTFSGVRMVVRTRPKGR